MKILDNSDFRLATPSEIKKWNTGKSVNKEVIRVTFF